MRRLIQYIFCLTMLIMSGCSGCSREGRGVRASRNIGSQQTIHKAASRTKGNSVVKMIKKGGVYHVPIEINGTQMEFVFDTGASDICISLTEAMFLIKQGKLSEDDIIGSENYQIADGSIVEGTVIILRDVKIGTKQLSNVRASVSHTISAPLLLGQSALARFGKISIDYNREEIIFE